MMTNRNLLMMTGAAVAIAAGAGGTQAGEPVAAAPAAGAKDVVPLVEETPEESFWKRHFTPVIDIRARYESVDTDGRSKAWAATLRTRLGLMLHGFGGFSALAEYEGNWPADRDSYQAASVHGLGQNKSIIADPESNELNRAWVAYNAWETDAKVGRQRIILDNARFVGNVGWRQNEQTFDAVRIDNYSIENLALHYAYVDRVNRIFGSETKHNPAQTDFQGNTHLANASYSGLPVGKLTGYGYWMDLHNDAGDASSNQTFGLSLAGDIPCGEDLKFPYYAEFAYQTDAFDSPLDYQAPYYHLKFSADYRGYSLGVAYESLGSDNGVGFQTPLATLHAFNGFNDVFLATPPDGLGDLYVFGAAKLPYGFVFKAWFHWFGDDGGSFDYGKEFDAVLVKKFNDNWSMLGKVAFYDADTYATDEQLYSIQIDYSF